MASAVGCTQGVLSTSPRQLWHVRRLTLAARRASGDDRDGQCSWAGSVGDSDRVAHASAAGAPRHRHIISYRIHPCRSALLSLQLKPRHYTAQYEGPAVLHAAHLRANRPACKPLPLLSPPAPAPSPAPLPRSHRHHRLSSLSAPPHRCPCRRDHHLRPAASAACLRRLPGQIGRACGGSSGRRRAGPSPTLHSWPPKLREKQHLTRLSRLLLPAKVAAHSWMAGRDCDSRL